MNFNQLSDFMPHGFCLNWSPELLLLHVGSDALMTLSYLVYPLGITYFVFKRKDMPYRWLWLGFFIAFIITCASTHFMSIITIWYPVYWLEGWIKLVSSLVAAATAIVIWFVIPQALKLPTPTQLQNAKKEAEYARDTAQAANKAKSIFLANMSHELRTPLNAILGFSSIIQKDTQLPPGQKRPLEIINRSGEHLLSLINDVLDMAKIDAGRIQVEASPFDLGRMVRDVADMMSIRAHDKNLQLIVDQSDHFPRYIVGDQARLRQILINLMGNAIKFTQQGCVTLRLDVDQTPRSHLIIEVEDTGCGIQPEDQPRVFDPFVQLGNQGDNKGTGLGLTITRQLVELMGGHIVLKSTVGKGSLFRVNIAFKAASAVEIAITQSRSQHTVVGVEPGQPIYRALIVEDQIENQLLLTQLLENIGMEVKVAKNGEEGIEQFQRWHPNIIWMDRRMPVMDGMEATKAIRQLPDGKDVPIIAVTASAFIEQRDEMLAIGMTDFLRKPYRAEEIYECLTKHLRMKFIYERVIPEEQALQITPDPRETVKNAHLDLMQSEAILRNHYTGATILLAEDNLINQDVAQQMLCAVGLKVEIANTGKQALDKARVFVYDVVLMDMQMPEMDGIEATQRLRELSGWQNVPIIAMTANALDEGRQTCLAAGMNDFISKPVSPELLYATLLRWLPKRAAELAQNLTTPTAQVAPHSNEIAFIAIPGLNFEKGLKMTGGRIDAYRRFLRLLVQYHQNDTQLLRHALAQHNWVELERIAHTLKGVAGSVAAEHIQTLAITLNDLVKQNAEMEHIERATHALMDALDLFIRAVRQALNLPSD